MPAEYSDPRMAEGSLDLQDDMNERCARKARGYSLLAALDLTAERSWHAFMLFSTVTFDSYSMP